MAHQFLFGIGALRGTRTDVTGVGPDQFGVLQDNMIDFDFALKELWGQLQFPVDIARGKGKITGKAKGARVLGNLYADMFFGAVATTGETQVSENESHTIATSVAVSNLTSFVADLGAYYGSGANVNNPLTYTTSAAPGALGFYSSDGAGHYFFFSGDVGATALISYVYTDGSGKTVAINNAFMGTTPTFAATFYQNRPTQGSTGQLTMRLNECVSSHLTFPSRIDDYAIPDFDFMAFSSQNNVIGTLSTSQ